jgi:general secretion pathway protein F
VTSFQFKAVTPDGKIRMGALPAESEKRAAAELRRQGLVPIYVGLEQQKAGFELKLPEFGGGRRKAVLYFTQELATLLNAGIPLDRALQISTELTEDKSFQLVVQDVLRVLKGGKTLADSLGTHPAHFSDLYLNMVRAGEASGQLGTMFTRLSEFEKTREDLRGYVISSLVYPGLLAFVGICSVFILLYFVIPRFAQVFEQARVQMPLPTLVMLQASKLMQQYGIVMLVVVAAAAFAFRYYLSTPAGRWWWDGYRLKVPLLGDTLRKMETARFARAMATLVANSVPLVQSIGIARGIMTNKVMAHSLESVSQGVKRGEGLATPIKRTAQFPALAGHLLMVGEETGKLDAMFERMADIYDTETRAAVKRFTSLFEPLIIVVMGVVVGALILSMLMAITSINEVAI